MSTTTVIVLDFLEELKEEGLSYSAINTARRALISCVVPNLGQAITNDPLISRLLKGTFNLHPPLPKYKDIWDVGVVLQYLRTLYPGQEISLKELSLKLCSLIALTTAQRMQTIHLLELQLRGSEKQFIISYRKPYLKVSKDTLARWVKTVLVSAGIGGQFKAHSTRASAALAAETSNVPVSDILDMAG
ncbi:hypothetical protein HOLleu_05414 [Holothuria leucospilota]|uniref:Tyr recombinase domain-containing protein n=1 Tax=Holothuria leucospilota TaxID=206669 RepID=A0A9Q1CLD0_HOLLE|nr:hypothetical protein HOLleu_05414 [Holothuria leucospilota]